MVYIFIYTYKLNDIILKYKLINHNLSDMMLGEGCMREEVKTLLGLLGNSEISSFVFKEPFDQLEGFDLGLRSTLVYVDGDPYESVARRVKQLKEKTLYHLEDGFHVDYAMFKLPDENEEEWVSVGPMLIEKPDGQTALAVLERLGLPAVLYHELMDYYERIPLVKSGEVFDAICFSIADMVFAGRSEYQVKIIHNSAESNVLQEMISKGEGLPKEDVEKKFDGIKKRYDLENAFLRMVMAGDTNGAISAFYRFRHHASDLERMTDRLRDKKDLSITLNTLLRKAAETAGVHPYYIDSFSNANVVRIEQCSNMTDISVFFRDLISGYCELIQQFAMNSYSQHVQNAIGLILSDLSADLSLAAIADKLNLTRSYLSNLFCKEVGMNLSDFVLEKRIAHAKHLLTTTPLSIQDIAWQVGIGDANYFSRLFKREAGTTPRQYREANHI